LVDVAEGDFESARNNYDDSADAYERAGMADSARTVRQTADALIEQRVPLEMVAHRVRFG
jgi:hypothetical protein